MSRQHEKRKRWLQLALVLVACISMLFGIINSLRPIFLPNQIFLCFVTANLAGLLSWRCRKNAAVPLKGSEQYLIAFVILIFLGQGVANSEVGRNLMYESIRKKDLSALHIWLTLSAPRDSVVPGESSTPLTAALLAENTDAVQLLLEAGANPNCRDRSHWSPLQVAQMNHNETAVVLLVLYGANDTKRPPLQPGTRTFTEQNANFLDLRQELDANR